MTREEILENIPQSRRKDIEKAFQFGVGFGYAKIYDEMNRKMTRFSDFTNEELDVMEEAFCNERLKHLVDEVRKERFSRKMEV